MYKLGLRVAVALNEIVMNSCLVAFSFDQEMNKFIREEVTFHSTFFLLCFGFVSDISMGQSGQNVICLSFLKLISERYSVHSDTFSVFLGNSKLGPQRISRNQLQLHLKNKSVGPRKQKEQ